MPEDYILRIKVAEAEDRAIGHGAAKLMADRIARTDALLKENGVVVKTK